MILLAEITLLDTRKNGIKSGYRPDWKINLQSEILNGGKVFLEKDYLEKLEKCEGLLYPLCEEYWDHITIDREIIGYEGKKPTITAKILKIFK